MIRIVLMLLAVSLLAAARPAPAAPARPPVEEIIFATRQASPGGHWYENFGYAAGDQNQKLYRPFGRLCRLNLRTGRLILLIDDPAGTVRDPQVAYDGKKILFSYRPGGTENFHLFEINADGSGRRQLTDGPYDDLEPTYLPDGRIMCCSSRARRWVNCWSTQVANLYVCDGDGRNLMPVSANIEQDNHPWPLPDGRVLYTRWEYVDRSRVSFHHLWTANPDGTGQMIYYGNQAPGTLMIDAKPVPGADQVVAIFSPGHGKREHAGAVTLVTPKTGPDDPGSARRISREGEDDYRDPYPLGGDAFLVARGASVLLMNGHGETKEIYKLPAELVKQKVECHEPRPLAARKREPVIPSRVEPAQATGRLMLSDVYAGRRMEGVKRGEIKKLLVLETLPKPINDSGKMPPMSFGGTYTLNRILGTVPVEADGSAYLEVPALRSIFFVALDAQDNSVQRMMSFCSVEPGETNGCVGCHEQRTFTPAATTGHGLPQAMRRPPSRIEKIEGIPDVIDFPRDIQPILDRNCLKCHDYDQRQGRVILAGDHGPVYSHSYFTLTALGYVSDGRDRVQTNLPPRAIGTSASPLMKMIDGGHYGARLTKHEQDTIRYWIESSAAYPGTYAALDCGMIGGYPHSQLDRSESKWPQAVAAAEAIGRRCASCHDKTMPLPRSLSDDMGLVLSNPREDDPRIRWSRHLMFNLSRPEQSLVMLAPLAKSAGGYGLCHSKKEQNISARPSPTPMGTAEQFDLPSRGLPAVSRATHGQDMKTTRNRGAVRQISTPDSAISGTPIFADRTDPDFQKILELCRAGQRELERIKRFDMPGFQPPPAYVREMKRFGILPATYEATTPLDVYATDQAYWRSHWWQPQRDKEKAGRAEHDRVAGMALTR